LPGPREVRRSPFAANPFRNWQFLTDLYCALDGIDRIRVPIPSSQKKAIQTVRETLKLLNERQFVHASFVSAAPLLVGGDAFVLQNLLSMVFWNISGERKRKPEAVAVEIESAEIMILRDGVALPKLLAAVDAEFAKVEWLFADPETESEGKWNVRKTSEALRKKPDWPKDVDLDRSLVFIGDRARVAKVCDRIVACFPEKFAAPAAGRALREALGLALVTRMV
jgi:hypothetical protein